MKQQEFLLRLFEDNHKLCIEKNIPILRWQTFQYIVEKINNNQYQSYLEIGTAFGYSSIGIYTFCSSINKINTIEKNNVHYLTAKSYIDQINDPSFVIVNEDAFEYTPSSTFDVILIDGPKQKQQQLITKYLPYLNQNGIMFIDNLYLKKFRNQEHKTPYMEKVLNDLNQLLIWLKNNDQFDFTLIDIDDGLGLITLRH
ncbi:O-methyltransferase [Ureaplasma canigenitalium]|uniref:O-methyltransferase n=1 Tax=Ureaplasma canigenitalium TaxID=42092 RepID=UPI0004E1596C|nr:class I SAM-dependent methyltransferase [Ureaplasma canigenitalium]